MEYLLEKRTKLLKIIKKCYQNFKKKLKEDSIYLNSNLLMKIFVYKMRSMIKFNTKNEFKLLEEMK